MDRKKIRLDVLMLNKGLAESREKIRALIMSGIVYVDGIKADKPGTRFSEDVNIDIKGNKLTYVSRGGLKLSKALEHFKIDVRDKITSDIGASTGGFTDCLLQNGATKVYAIDVGYGQLAWKLRNDSRVVVMERTNVRYVTPSMFQEKIDFATIDVSFISLTKVLPAVSVLMSDKGEIVCLIKPQFEAGKDKVGKKGVVREPEIHIEVITYLFKYFEEILKIGIKGLTYSPIKGPEGNIEYLVYLRKDISQTMASSDISISEVVKEAHTEL